MSNNSNMIFVRALREFPYHEHAFAAGEVIQMTRREALIFQRERMVKIESITLEQHVPGTVGCLLINRTVKL